AVVLDGALLLFLRDRGISRCQGYFAAPHPANCRVVADCGHCERWTTGTPLSILRFICSLMPPVNSLGACESVLQCLADGQQSAQNHADHTLIAERRSDYELSYLIQIQECATESKRPQVR